MTYIFDDYKSIIHFFAGLITACIPFLNVIILLIYILYQLLEDEIVIRKIGDVQEFILGFIAGYTLQSTLKAILLKSGSFG